MSSPAEASANEEDVALYTLLGIALGSDAYFTGRAIALAAEEDEPFVGASIGEAAFAAPQVLLMTMGLVLTTEEHDGEDTLLWVVPGASMVNAMLVHGMWTAQQPGTDMTRAFALSTFAGIDLAWTTVILGHSFIGEMSASTVGPWMIASAAPGIAVGIHQSFEDTAAYRGAWVAQTAWSGAVAAYGIVALTGVLDGRHEPTIIVMPSAIPRGDGTAPGIVASGAF